MPGAKSDTLKNQTVTHLFSGDVGIVPPTEWWLALYSQDPTSAVNASTTAVTSLLQLVEVGGDPVWTINAHEASNTYDIQYPQVPAGETWSVTHFAIFNSDSGGEALYYGSFNTGKVYSEGDILIIPSGQLVIREF
jgi:hypothetical protein